VKTNIIINEGEFLYSYLTKISYLRAKEFIIYNYAIFTNDEFINNQKKKDDMIENMQSYRVQEQLSVITTYVQNWIFIVNSYKDYTEYGNSTSDKKVKKVSLGIRLCKVLKIGSEKFLNLSRHSTYNEYFAVLATEVLKMIPFLGNVPFLSSILASVFAYFAEFVINLIVKFFVEAGPVIASFIHNVTPVFGKMLNKEIYDLDYKKYIDEGVEVDDGQSRDAQIKINLYDIEKEYLVTIEKANSEAHDVE
jgi:hypothetical protein